MGKEIQNSRRWVAFLLLAVFTTIASAQSIDVYEKVYWWDVNDTYSTSINASESLTASYDMTWPYNVGDPNSVLMTDGTGVLRWALVDPNLINPDPNDPNDPNWISLPTLTPGSIIFVDTDGFPLFEDNPNLFFDDVNDFVGIALGHIAGDPKPNNHIQVRYLLNFDPDLLNVSIGWARNDVLDGPNNVRLGEGAGGALETAYRNALGGKNAGRNLIEVNDNTGWGYNVIGGDRKEIEVGHTEYFVGTNFEAPYTYNILVNATTLSTIDTSWGSSGYFGYEIPATGAGTITPYDMFQLDDGRTLVAHNNFVIGSDTYSAVMVNTDGTLDTTWGTGGFFVLPTASAYWTFYKILQDNDGSFHFFGGRGGVGFSGYVKVDAAGIFDYTSPLAQYEAFGFVDAAWSDSTKTRILAIGISDTAIWTGSGYVQANIMAIDPSDGERDETWPGNLGYAGFADFGGGYFIRLLSDGGFVTFQNGSPTIQKFLADGSALDTTWGTNGTLDIGDFTLNTFAQRITVDGDYIYTITNNTIASVINNTISKIDSTGTVTEEVNLATGSNGGYHSIQAINDQLVVGTLASAPAQFNVEFWSRDLVYESGFDITNVSFIYYIFPDEVTYTGPDVHRVAAFGTRAAGLVSEGADDGLYLGNYSGAYNETDPNVFYLDNLDRGTYEAGKVHSMMYGYFAADANDQWLNINVGELNLDFGRFDVNDVNIAGDLILDGFSAGSVLFADSSGIVSENNANLSWDDTNLTLDVNAVDVNNVTVLKPNSAVFQPNADSLTFFQILDADGGTPVFNVDSTNERVGIRNASPSYTLDVGGSIRAKAANHQIRIHDTDSGVDEWTFTTSGNVDLSIFEVGVVTRATFKAGGNILLPGAVSIGTNNSPERTLHVEGASALILLRRANNVFGPGFLMQRQRGGGADAQNGDEAGKFTFAPFLNGAAREIGAFSGFVDGVPSPTSYPGKFTCVLTEQGDTTPTERFTIRHNGFSGFSEAAPETLIELTHATPYITLHNSTHEDSDGGRESRLNFKGEQSGGEETTLARIEVGHDGAADDEKGYLDEFINDGDDGDTPTKTRRVDSLGTVFETGPIFLKETTTPTARTNYAAIYATSDNELFWQDGAGTEHLLHGDSFSNIWYHGISTVEVTISAQNTFTIIDSFTVVGHEDDLANLVGSSANNNLTLSSIGGGEYEVSYHGSVTATGGADKDMMFALGITLATPKDITNVTDDTITPIVITSTAHGLEDGDMVEIVGVLVNTAANGSFIVNNKTANTFEIVKLDGSATTGNGDYDEGTPTGDVTIEYVGNMVVHRMVRGADLGAMSATGLHIFANNDVLALYVANTSGTTNLTVAAVSFDANRIGD